MAVVVLCTFPFVKALVRAGASRARACEKTVRALVLLDAAGQLIGRPSSPVL